MQTKAAAVEVTWKLPGTCLGSCLEAAFGQLPLKLPCQCSMGFWYHHNDLHLPHGIMALFADRRSPLRLDWDVHHVHGSMVFKARV